MSLLGRIEQWNDARGYGFVRPLESQAGDAARAFVHVRAIERAGRRPADGDLVRYATERDDKGRLNAVRVSFVNATAMRRQAEARGDARADARRRQATARLGNALRRGALAAATALLAGGWLMGEWGGAVVLWFAVASLLSFLSYRHDKVSAERGRWRTPERILHLLDLAGGWPGGLLAQQVLRHKSSKPSFQAVFWGTVALNIAAFAWLLHDGSLDAFLQALA
ncbi:DUF1294 domain-containing protein [Luteimonas composti]|uniref:DUF1294 domain-containing protein n=1 Tax=Luteimonas composti TaxID=398257 RepID=A0ABT6MUH9_9GAMM|nr:DUF1294 domain-containing protein [Luteimonas composti]MDH7453955.1 DUF1294 domain-containing protein [Luteimonas composti]